MRPSYKNFLEFLFWIAYTLFFCFAVVLKTDLPLWQQVFLIILIFFGIDSAHDKWGKI